MSYAASEVGRDRQNARAALFIDYDNLNHTLAEQVRERSKRERLITEMLDALKQSLLEEQSTQTAVARAYADFANLDGNGDSVQRSLYLQGVESCYVPGTLASTTVEIQLCVDAMEVLHHRSDINMFVLLTGRRTYLPLVQHFKRYSRRVLVAAFDEPAANDRGQHSDDIHFFDARDLLSSLGSVDLGPRGHTIASGTNGTSSSGSEDAFLGIHDPMLLRALEIIEEHFGQYDEVYLTPLLRKMSEILDERTCDPKALVSSLEEHAAVRLEKRQGFPHDYTVLIVNRDHPDVARVQQAFEETDEFYREDRRSSSRGPIPEAHGEGSELDDFEYQDEFEIDYDGRMSVDGQFEDFDGDADARSDGDVDGRYDDDDYDAIQEDDEFEGDDYDYPSREG